jgi:arylsulfatase A-like enzyme
MAFFVDAPGFLRQFVAMLKKLRLVFLKSLALASVAFVWSLAATAGEQASTLAPAPRRPNIIFILADDLGYGDLGCYGQTKIKTPNLDQLAAEGMRFTDFYAGSTVCAPSRAALMTGFHCGHTGIRGNSDALALTPKDLTVAEILKLSGYYTGLVGKWGLGHEGTTGVPNLKGFDEFLGYLDQVHAHDYYTDHLWRYDPRTHYDGQSVFMQNEDGKKGAYIPDMLSLAATNFVKINKPDQFNHYRPFFLYLAYTIPHANNEEGARTGNGMQVPSDAPYSSESWPQVEKNKAAMITRMDRDIGTLIQRLRELKVDDNTVVFFSSDNGPHKEGGVDPTFFNSSGPLRGIKRDLYEGGIRVPLIVRWPGKIKPGQVSDLNAAFWDVLPTLAEIAGAARPKPVDGISFLPTLLGKPQTNHHDFLYWEFHEGGFKQAARHGDWKAVRLKPESGLELYNLKTDIGETNNVASSKSNIVSTFETFFKTARTEDANWPIKKPDAPKTQSNGASPPR